MSEHLMTPSTGDAIHCRGCGWRMASVWPEIPIPERCGHCPPWTCGDCEQPTSFADPCPCWVSLEGMALADIKAIFANDPELAIGGLVDLP